MIEIKCANCKEIHKHQLIEDCFRHYWYVCVKCGHKVVQELIDSFDVEVYNRYV